MGTGSNFLLFPIKNVLIAAAVLIKSGFLNSAQKLNLDNHGTRAASIRLVRSTRAFSIIHAGSFGRDMDRKILVLPRHSPAQLSYPNKKAIHLVDEPPILLFEVHAQRDSNSRPHGSKSFRPLVRILVKIAIAT